MALNREIVQGPGSQPRENKQGELARLTITAYEVDKFDNTFSKLKSMKVTINPDSYQLKYSSHSEGIKVGNKTINSLELANGKIVDLKVIQFREALSFELWFDSTGAIPDSGDVKTDIKTLQDMLVKYNGKIHSTNYAKIQWGDLRFVGQLQDMSVAFLLFDNKGEPLRAKVNLSFSEMIDPQTRSKIEDDQSPDLTHLHRAQAGDNLPLMCYRIYRDPSFYLQVAEANGLPNLINLQAGQEIEFPPLDE